MLRFTMLLGVAFLVIKGIEYTQEYREGLIPMISWHPELHAGVAEGSVKLFMIFYFCMTALHATHMIVGLGLFAYLVRKTRRGALLARLSHTG